MKSCQNKSANVSTNDKIWKILKKDIDIDFAKKFFPRVELHSHVRKVII